MKRITIGASFFAAALLSAPAVAQNQRDRGAALDAELSDEADDEGEEAFPLHANLSMSNSLGSGWFGPGFTQVPTWNTGLSLRPSYTIPKLADWMPKMSVGASQAVSIQWISNQQSSVFDRIPRLSDFGLSLRAGNIYKEEVTGIKFGANLSSSLPLSVFSRQQNRLGTLGIGVNTGWSTSHLKELDIELPEWLGSFNVGYSPGITGFGYTRNSATFPCDALAQQPTLAGLIPTGDPARDTTDLPVGFARQAEEVGDGQCRLSGRQGLFSLRNGFSLGWSLDNHSVGANVGISHTFVRPLSDADLASQFASGQGFREGTSAGISYSYDIPTEWLNLPVDTNASLSAGLQSGQPAFSADNKSIRFPFWDFISPQNNFSSAFLSLSVGL